MQRAYPVLGVAIVSLLIGSGLYYLQLKPAAPIAYAPSPVATPIQNVSFRVLETGGNAVKVTAPKNYAAYSQAGLIRLWGLVHDTDGTVPPPVDFAKEYVIGVFGGQKPTGGYSVAVTSVTDDGSTRMVTVTLTKPGAGCVVNQMVTSPYQIVAVPIGNSVLAHAESEISAPCK